FLGFPRVFRRLLEGGPKSVISGTRCCGVCDLGLLEKQKTSFGHAPSGPAWEKSPMEIQVRDATEADLPAIVDIYNQSIPGGWSTADTTPITVADRVEWFRKFDPARRPIWVAEADGRVVAAAYLSSFYGGRPAYDATAEMSVYIATAYQRQRIGRR